MKPVDLDFLNKRSVVTGAGWFLLLAGIALGAWVVGTYSQARLEQEKIKTRLARLHDYRAPGGESGKDMEPELRQAAAAIDQLSFPWNKLFKIVESSVDQDVALLSIEPDINGDVVMLNAEARDWNAMLAYMKRLAAEKSFTDVHLVSHQMQQADPQKPVRFVLSCSWSDAFRN